MVHGKNRIPYRIDRSLTGLAGPDLMPPSRSGCPMSLKTPNMENTGSRTIASRTNGVVRLRAGFKSTAQEYLSISCLL